MLSSLDIQEANFEVSVQTRRLDPYVLAIGSARFESPVRKLGPHPTATLHLVVDGRIRSSRGFADEREALAAWDFSTERDRLHFDAAPDPLALPDGRTKRQRPGDPDAALLTPREREVLTLLALGLNGPQTADRLFISPATVRTHVENAMKTLGARTRTQAVAEALIRGEIQLHPPGPGDR
jgi:DNA-binding CsgD family transcriptional regulator